MPMSDRLLPVCLMALLPLLGTGCLSVLNMRNGYDPKFKFVNKVSPKSIYGGVQLEAVMISEGAVLTFTDPDMSLKERALVPVEGLLCLADLPFEAVADTLFLPWTVSATFRRWFSSESQAPRDDPIEVPSYPAFYKTGPLPEQEPEASKKSDPPSLPTYWATARQ